MCTHVEGSGCTSCKKFFAQTEKVAVEQSCSCNTQSSHKSCSQQKQCCEDRKVSSGQNNCVCKAQSEK